MIEPPLGLLDHLIALRSALYEQWATRANKPVINLDSPTHLKLELLPYAVSEMWHALTSFIRTAHSIASEMGEDIPHLPECFFLSDQERDLLSYSIDLFMDSGRRAQNAVLHYLSGALGPLERSLPNSLVDVFIKKCDQTNLTRYPALKPFAPVLESYWSTDGRRLRAYRDLMQHHMLVATEAFLGRSDAGVVCLHILLPNNPEVKSQAKLTYNPPEHALPFMEQAFTAFVRFADSMTQPLLPVPFKPKIYFIAANRIAPVRTPKEFHPIPSIEEISVRVQQLAQASVPPPSAHGRMRGAED
jgi:hypothetical protein